MEGEHFKLLGGHLALDFANTADWHARAEPEELLTGYGRLLDWGEQAGALPTDEAAVLRRTAAARSREAVAALERAIATREAIYGLFSALAAGRPAPAADLTALNAALTEALAHLQLAAEGDALAWAWAGEPGAFERPLWPVVRAAAELLTAPERNLVRECAGGDCGWLFLDTSRNHSRRWCDTRSCGNRLRVRRHYARQRGHALAGPENAAR